MARGSIDVTGNTWVKFVDGATAASFQNKGGRAMYVAVAATDVAPTDGHDQWPEYKPGTGEANLTLSDLCPDVTGAQYAWAFFPGIDGGKVWRSHG